MAEATCKKSVHFLAAFILCLAVTGISLSDGAKTPCTCHHVDSNFEETIKAEVHNTCRKCFKFVYDFTVEQNWTTRVCVSSQEVSRHSPILVVVREYFSALSFSVPQIPDGEKNSSFTDVCHTLCPLANYFEEKLNGTKQNLYVEISSQNENPVQFEVRVSKLYDFIIVTDQPFTVNVTPSQPQVLQYNMEENIDTVRVEAASSDSSCMVLAIQDIKCPFSDFESTMPHYSGFYQTLMTQSGISISKKFFPMGRVYIVLILKATNEECMECCESDENLSKEVTVTVVPPISDSKFLWGIVGPVLFYLIVFYFSAFGYYCCCRRISLPPSICCTGRQEESSTVVDMHNPRDVERFTEDHNLNTGNVCYLSELAQENEDDLMKRSNIYAWNLLTVAIFYLLPVFQLVYMNQGNVNRTGNQDLCYYNFLCSHQWWEFSDLNHVWSNIGYIMLGVLFLIIVKLRESVYKRTILARCKDWLDMRKDEITGIGNFGLYRSMGFALIMEGFLSACYHVCPSQTNFQFDTTFMYVICVLSMLKLYQARHPDSTVESHAAWMILAGLVTLSFIGGQSGLDYLGILIAVSIGQFLVTFYTTFKIYFLNYRNPNIGCYETIKRDWKNPQYSLMKHNRVRLVLLILIGIINVVLIIYNGAKQESIPMCILNYLICNLFLYIIYYIVMKLTNGEKIPIYSVVYLVAAITLWKISYDYFDKKRAQWELTPAESREKNVHCISGMFLDFYDDHDVWHFGSSIAIFFSYLVPFTIDDYLEEKRRDQIIVF